MLRRIALITSYNYPAGLARSQAMSSYVKLRHLVLGFFFLASLASESLDLRVVDFSAPFEAFEAFASPLLRRAWAFGDETQLGC